jgi:hypothetical protein
MSNKTYVEGGDVRFLDSDSSTRVLMSVSADSQVDFTGVGGAAVTITGTVTKNKHTTVNAATYTVLAADSVLSVTYTSTGACTLTLPQVSAVPLRTYVIKDAGRNAGLNHITIDCFSGDTLEGETSGEMDGDGQAVTIYNDGGTEWHVIGA